MMRYDPYRDRFIEGETTGISNYAYGTGTINLPQTLQIELSDACIEKIANAIARKMRGDTDMAIKALQAQPEIIRCKDCRHNHNCEIQYHAQADDLFYCGWGAEERKEAQA